MWQTIESAPRDGCLVDLWMVDERGNCWREPDAYFVRCREELFSTYSGGARYYERQERDGWFAPNHDYDGQDGFCDRPPRFYGIPKVETFKTPTHWMPLPDPPAI